MLRVLPGPGRLIVALAIVMTVPLHGPHASSNDGVPRHAEPVLCNDAIQHPLDVRVRALGEIRRGAPLRLEVTTTAAHGIERGSIRLVSAGGARLAGPDRAALGPLTAGATASRVFDVIVPESGPRVLVQFRVSGEGEGGIASRGATFNILPDGPADPGRLVTADDGTRILEFRARRIDR